MTKRQGKTTILISHRPKVINCADWIIFLESGKVKFSNTIKKFRSEFGNASDFLSP